MDKRKSFLLKTDTIFAKIYAFVKIKLRFEKKNLSHGWLGTFSMRPKHVPVPICSGDNFPIYLRYTEWLPKARIFHLLV